MSNQLAVKFSIEQGVNGWVQTFYMVQIKGVERRGLWQHLGFIKKQIGRVPWLLTRDFNVVKNLKEKWDGKSLINCYEPEFGECVN